MNDDKRPGSDPFTEWLSKQPIGGPMSAEAKQGIEDYRALKVMGSGGVSTEQVLASAIRMNSDDPAVAADARAEVEERAKRTRAMIAEGRRLLGKSVDDLAKEVVRLRGILIQCAQNHPESAEWIVAMVTPLDGSFDPTQEAKRG